MSRIVTQECLVNLRKTFSDLDPNETSTWFTEEFVIDQLQTEVVDYPSFSDDDLSRFYKQYTDDPKNEFELAKIIYEALPLSPEQAANNLYWINLNLRSFYGYIKERWVENKLNVSEEKLKNEFVKQFITLDPSQNSLMKAPIAGLWWAVHLTTNKKLSDEYFYTKIYLSERNLRDKNLGSQQFIRDRKCLFALLDFFNENKDHEINGKRIGSEAIAQQMSVLLNQLGGVTLLSFLSEKEIKSRLDLYADVIFDRAAGVQEKKVVSREKIQEEKKNESANSTILVTPENCSHYFCLNSGNGTYFLSENTNFNGNWDFIVPIDLNNDNANLVHVYEEGKIKISDLNSFRDKDNRGRLGIENVYSNGCNRKLTLKNVYCTTANAIFGVLYMVDSRLYVKFFDQIGKKAVLGKLNSDINQEGKKIFYQDQYEFIDSLVLASELRGKLERLFKSPQAIGINVLAKEYQPEIEYLSKRWGALSFFISKMKKEA